MIEFKKPDQEDEASIQTDKSEQEEFEGALDSFRKGMKQIWPGSGINSETIDDFEAALLQSDVSIRTVDILLEPLRENPDIQDGTSFLREKILDILSEAGDRRLIQAETPPTIYFFVGVNGSGKTTTIAKLTHLLQPEHEVMFAAGDTFRAAAIDQLERWANKLDVELIAHEKGGDPSAVVYDAIEAAQNRECDFLFVDTAGRLHTRGDLMDQLSKMFEVVGKKMPNAPHESLLVLDASTGQNGLRQVDTFAEELPVSGMALTKLDSTAKGGIILTVADELGVPVKLVGTGEERDDLVMFQPDTFCESLLVESNIT